ncbi:hypothetical protein QCN29_30555 [Streptomyces sp. HNM0663]|uniref:Uncharacterized protein n=1 Tax=Streptomyces chengmaiensis TaxID=3040919 RepID=A0ABT6HWF3_9ACTN|nr:hypothetical protein [Streptomyces chengmaiensis]MDH2393041.1 hypothetical protein [Streptomyces chengmaiensis]
MSTDEVCGAFAKEASVSAALKALVGDGRLRDSLSEPDDVLKKLRANGRIAQSGKEDVPRMQQAVPYCVLMSTDDRDVDFRIQFRESLGVPERNARLDQGKTFYASGERADSSDTVAAVFFKCRMKAPAHEIVVHAQLARSDTGVGVQKDAREHQITVLNAAALKVAADLDCQNDTKLAKGVPHVEAGA